MKEKVVSTAAVTIVLTVSLTAFAASGPVMFGDVPQHTHNNGLADSYPWTKECFLQTAEGVSLAGNSTAIGEGDQLFYPVSAPSDDPTGTGYMVGFNTGAGNWHWNTSSSQYEPTVEFVQPIKGVSNSSPVYDPSTGDAYLAAGDTLYAFTSHGEDPGIPLNPGNLGTATPVFQNQVVSYPLYVTGAQQGTTHDDIWVSSQNGYLYAVNPTTLQDDWKVYLGERLDASPALVQATDGTSYVAVTAAYKVNNKMWNGFPGTGMLFLINPRDGAITMTAADPAGAISSVSSPIGISPGLVMWNDVMGDVFLGHVQSNGTVLAEGKYEWDQIGGTATAYDAEAGYSEDAHEYILPFTDNGSHGVGIVDTQSGQSWLHNDPYGDFNPSGSPEISAGDGHGNDNLYLPDLSGWLDEAVADPTTHKFDSGSQSAWLPTWSISTVNSLTSPSELNLGSFNGSVEPTLTLATNMGLEMWVNTGANYIFGSGASSGGDWTNSSASAFDYPLTLTYNQSQSNLPAPAWYGTTDQFDYEMSVNGGSYVFVSGLPNADINVFDASGNPQSKITISTDTLNQLFAPWTSPDWKSGEPNAVSIRVLASHADTYGYTFNSPDVGNGKTYGDIVIQFPAQSGTTPISPTDPSYGCVSTNYVSCSSSLPGYVEYRWYAPGAIDIHEGDMMGYNNPGSPQPPKAPAYKLHPIPEQAINSTPAAATTDYYGLNWANNFSVETVNATGQNVSYALQMKINTTGDVLYKKRYISAWQPHWSQSCDPNGNNGCNWVWGGYTPIYSNEYLYGNASVTEVANSGPITHYDNATQVWDPSSFTVTAGGSFLDNESTPITPGGSSLTWTQPVLATYGPWVSESEVYQNHESQKDGLSGIGKAADVNNMLAGTPADDRPANVPAPDGVPNTWYSDAPMPSIPSAGDSAPQGQPVSHPFDTEHNGGVLYEPQVAESSYPAMGNPEWFINPTVSVTSGGQWFEHPAISTWINSWSPLWGNNSGEGVPSGGSSSMIWSWSSN